MTRKDGTSPTISLVTPSFNQGQYLEQAIESVLSQDYPDLEYIIIDGGSMDGSVEIIKKHEEHLACWVSEPDRGQSHALNKGFRKSTGEILGWLCADDLLCPGALRAAGEYSASRPEIDVVYGDSFIIDAEGKKTRFCKKLSFDRELFLNAGNWLHQQSTFWRRKLFFAVGMLDESRVTGMDTDLFIRFALSGAEFAKMEGVVGCFRRYRTAKSFALYRPSLIEIAEQARKYGLPRPGSTRAFYWRARYILRALREGIYWARPAGGGHARADAGAPTRRKKPDS